MLQFEESDIAFVTGGGSGIGRATCQLLAEQGATVVVADINKKSADETILSLSGNRHTCVQLDATIQHEVEAAIAAVILKYSSPPTIAVNCAGLLDVSSLLDVTEETFDRIFNINVKATVWVTQTVCRQLVESKMKGTIINIASIAERGSAGATIYAASKGAVAAFSKSVAKEFGGYGIRINAISPGQIDTPMVKIIPEERKKRHCERNPLRRTGKPEEVAEVIVFLASDKCSYINGDCIFVHGGIL